MRARSSSSDLAGGASGKYNHGSYRVDGRLKERGRNAIPKSKIDFNKIWSSGIQRIRRGDRFRSPGVDSDSDVVTHSPRSPLPLSGVDASGTPSPGGYSSVPPVSTTMARSSLPPVSMTMVTESPGSRVILPRGSPPSPPSPPSAPPPIVN